MKLYTTVLSLCVGIALVDARGVRGPTSAGIKHAAAESNFAKLMAAQAKAGAVGKRAAKAGADKIEKTDKTEKTEQTDTAAAKRERKTKTAAAAAKRAAAQHGAQAGAETTEATAASGRWQQYD